MKKVLIGFIAMAPLMFVGCEKEKEYVNCDGSTFTWNDVTNPTTGRTWMDRNLGARQVATSSMDYSVGGTVSGGDGNLYQWGRGSDEHQCRGSEATTILSDKDSPVHGNFIVIDEGLNDWRNPQNDELWQGVDGKNNPCPTGYRLPTKTEWEEEVESWTSEDHNGAFGSVLKLTMAGNRRSNSIGLYGVDGGYWSSTVSGSDAHALYFGFGNANMITSNRANGCSVRCIKD